MIAIRENLILVGQIRAAGIDQVDAGQTVLLGDLLSSQVFLDRDRKIGTAFHRGIVTDDDAFCARDSTDTGDYASAGAASPYIP